MSNAVLTPGISEQELSRQFLQLSTNSSPATVRQWAQAAAEIVVRDGNSHLRVHSQLAVVGTVLQCTFRPMLEIPDHGMALFQQFLDKAEKTDPQLQPVAALLEETLSQYLSLLYDASGQDASPLIRSVCRYIQQNLTQRLTLRDIAARYQIDRSVLCRKFKRETGTTLSNYVNQQRVKAACQYFQNGCTNVMEVSQLVGYEDSNYFSRVFKIHTGQSPRAYIRSLQQAFPSEKANIQKQA